MFLHREDQPFNNIHSEITVVYCEKHTKYCIQLVANTQSCLMLKQVADIVTVL